MRDYPVSIGNITYMNGNPDEDHLAAVVAQMSRGVDVEGAMSTFSETLRRAGRPSNSADIVIEYGPRITDWLIGKAFIRPVPWHRCYWCQDIDMPMFELHSSERSGWCAEVCDGILLHMRFYGTKGLNSHEMACLLSESADPHPALVEWLQGFLDDEYHSFLIEDVSAEIPESLKTHLGYSFQCNKRIASMSLGGDESQALFIASERDRDLERVLFSMA